MRLAWTVVLAQILIVPVLVGQYVDALLSVAMMPR